MASQTVLTTFLIISDTHNFQFDDAVGPFRLPLPKVDVVLHCGDLTHCGGAASYKKALQMLSAIDAELELVIAGNHDLDLDGIHWMNNLQDDDKPEEHSLAVEIMTGPLATQAGVTYLTEGTYTFFLSTGAKFTIYASPYQPEFNNWAFGYERDQDRFNLPEQVAEEVTSIATNPVPSFPAVDVMMTHGPPRGMLDSQGLGCENLLRAVGRVVRCKGDEVAVIDGEKEKEVENTFPQSRNEGMVFGRETLMVNAAILDGKNQPINAPWLVELDLPRSEQN